MDQDLIYYLNGEYVTASQAALPLADLGIIRGYGVFDLLRTYDGVPFQLRPHLERLLRSSAGIGLQLPWSLAQLEEIVLDTYAQNREVPDASIRIVVTGGLADDFMTPANQPTLAVMVAPLRSPADEFYRNGCRVVTTTVERVMPAVKSLNYIGAIVAMAEAKKSGAIEAIYRTADGRLTEGTRSNLFVIRDGVLSTPKEGVLAGITRQVVLELASDELEVMEAPLIASDLASIDEAFLTSTTKEIMPVVRVDDISIGMGVVGPQTRRLLERFHHFVATCSGTQNGRRARN